MVSFAEDDTSVARLRGHLQVDGGIIIWSTFWENISRLMSGTSLDDLFDAKIDPSCQNLQTTEGRIRSDSDIARELESKINGSSSNYGHTEQAAVKTSQPISASSVASLDFSSLLGSLDSVDNCKESSRNRSDSDIAKELQRQFDEDAEIPELVSVDNEDSEMANAIAKSMENFQQQKNDDDALHHCDSVADDSAEGLQLFHFNGLEAHGRPARLSKFLLFKRSSDNAVGQSIAFSGGESCFANSHLEEVLRTRWPGCRVDWLGQSVPSLD